MKRAGAKLALLFSALVLSGCQQDRCERGEVTCNELPNKPEYSLLESFLASLDEETGNQPIIIAPNVLDSDYTGLAFPARDGNRYVVMLADADVSPRDKTVPLADFNVSQEAMQVLIESDMQPSPEARALIEQMASSTS